jgi:hypothetical protein
MQPLSKTDIPVGSSFIPSPSIAVASTASTIKSNTNKEKRNKKRTELMTGMGTKRNNIMQEKKQGPPLGGGQPAHVPTTPLRHPPQRREN